MPIEYRPSVIGKCFIIGDIEKAQVYVKIDVTLLLLLRMLQQAHLECRIKVKISITNRWQPSISTHLPLP